MGACPQMNFMKFARASATVIFRREPGTRSCGRPTLRSGPFGKRPSAKVHEPFVHVQLHEQPSERQVAHEELQTRDRLRIVQIHAAERGIRLAIGVRIAVVDVPASFGKGHPLLAQHVDQALMILIPARIEHDEVVHVIFAHVRIRVPRSTPTAFSQSGDGANDESARGRP